MRIDRVFLKKVVAAFVIGFMGTFATSYGQVADAISAAVNGKADFSVVLSLLYALAAGAVIAGLRAAVALFTNLIPGDEAHGLSAWRKKPPPDPTKVAASEAIVEADEAPKSAGTRRQRRSS
jgi:hypothetical protein